MSFSHLIHNKDDADKVVAWEHLFLEIQVLLAFADDHLDPSERMTLSVLSLARSEKGNLDHVNDTVKRVEKQGLSAVAKDVFASTQALLLDEPAEARGKIAQYILRRSLAVVAADGVVSPNERKFVLRHLAPGLRIDEELATRTLNKLDEELSLQRVYVERAFEMYVMLVDEAPHAPVLNTRDGEPLSGFLGAVDQLVAQHQLASSRSVAYFLSALGGTLWVDRYRSFINYFSRLTVQVRQLGRTSGRRGRLKLIHEEIAQVRDSGRDSFALRTVQRHMLNAMSKMVVMDEKQIVLFRDEIAPVLELSFDSLLESLQGKPSMLGLLHNLQGAHPSSNAEDGVWWKFWT